MAGVSVYIVGPDVINISAAFKTNVGEGVDIGPVVKIKSIPTSVDVIDIGVKANIGVIRVKC